MSTSKFDGVKKGDKLRIVMEVDVARGPDENGDIWTEGYGYIVNKDYIKEVTVIETGEYEGGAYYMDAEGDVCEYDADDRKWWQTGSTHALPFNYPVRPLRKMEPVG
jgi:hypothetical protein